MSQAGVVGKLGYIAFAENEAKSVFQYQPSTCAKGGNGGFTRRRLRLSALSLRAQAIDDKSNENKGNLARTIGRL